MFVGSTLLCGIDRLSVKSVLTGKVGTLCGVIASIVFVILCFIIFLGPVINYFRGNYIQGSFSTSQVEDLQQYTGCDFKLAISFHLKETGAPANHTRVQEMIKSQTYYISPDRKEFYAELNSCSEDYFSQMAVKPQNFSKEDCLIVDNGIGYLNTMVNDFYSVFGFKFVPFCKDPLTCTSLKNLVPGQVSEWLRFFQNHYYVLYFTSNIINRLGHQEKIFNAVYSTQWAQHNTIIPRIYVLEKTEKVYMDNSIMPWVNNQTILQSIWEGKIDGDTISADNIQLTGISAFITTLSDQYITFREYKKLDWLLGMLGGGIYLLYLFFWIVCNYISKTKQQIQNCESLVLVHDGSLAVEDLRKPNLGYAIYLINLIPFSLSCFRAQQQIIEQSQRMLDIVSLIKKQKVAIRNLTKNKKFEDFSPRKLVLSSDDAQQIVSANPTKEEQTLELSFDTLKTLREQANIPIIYENNISMLAINGSEMAENCIEKLEKNPFSKHRYANFGEKKEKCEKFKSKIACVLRLFDVFGATPNLTGHPANSSICGCLITFLIIVLSILTFALTLGNMGKTKIYMDQAFVGAQQLSVKVKINKDYKMLLCFHPQAILDNMVVGNNRVANVKYYQYHREGLGSAAKETFYYYDAVRLGSSETYFDVTNEMYSGTELPSCFKAPQGQQFIVYGSDSTEKQGYFGVSLTPYCSSLPATCQQNAAEIKAKFYALINVYPMWIIVPENKYFPNEGRIISNALGRRLLQTVYLYNINNTRRAIEETIYMSTLELVDDTSSWIVGDHPMPFEKTLTNQYRNMIWITEDKITTDPYYLLKVKTNGHVEQVVFSNYKVDFLFATIGGIFAFYYVIFGWIGKSYNQYAVKAKLAETLYDENDEGQNCFAHLCKMLRIPCYKDHVINKVDRDLDCVNLAQNVSNCYYLSTSNFSSLEQKNLALIYLKERIKEDEQILIKKKNESQSSSDDDNFEQDWEAEKVKQKLNKNKVTNVNSEFLQNQENLQKQFIEVENSLEIENQYEKSYTPNRRRSKLHSIINHLDFFNNQQELTFDGKRKVRSICGGICCIVILIFIIILTVHFVHIYFSNMRFVSSEKIVHNHDKDEESMILLETGKNFKFMVSFFKDSDNQFLNVRSLVADVGLSVVKYSIKRVKNEPLVLKKQFIHLEACQQKYLDGFTNEYSDANYYKDIKNAYCVPDGSVMKLSGSSNDELREYFSVQIYNKNESASGLDKVKELLSTYLIRYHISQPIKDFNTNNKIVYSMITVIKSLGYQTSTSRVYNITLENMQIEYDTAINPSNEYPKENSYQVKVYQADELTDVISDSTDRFCRMYFYQEDFYSKYTVKKIKVDELFGMIGGCIIMVGMFLGCFAKSFNEYRMRYLIGCRLYTVMGKKNPTVGKKKRVWKSKTVQSRSDEVMNFSEWKLLKAWFLSFWGFLKDYNHSLKAVPLIESRVSQDMNLFEFYKNLYACESSIKKMNLTQNNTPNLCRTYPKALVSSKVEEKKKISVKDVDPELQQAAKVNRFSDWEISVISNAYEKGISAASLFDEKWLDKYWGVDRSRPSSVASKTMMKQSRKQNAVSEQQSLENMHKEMQEDALYNDQESHDIE